MNCPNDLYFDKTSNTYRCNNPNCTPCDTGFPVEQDQLRKVHRERAELGLEEKKKVKFTPCTEEHSFRLISRDFRGIGGTRTRDVLQCAICGGLATLRGIKKVKTDKNNNKTTTTPPLVELLCPVCGKITDRSSQKGTCSNCSE